MPPTPDLSAMSLADVAKVLAEQRLPPVDQWHPTHCGDSEMRIARDGTWYHQGSPIGREAMVRLFSTILRREADGSYVLVTPGEKLDIIVEDAPFIAVEVKTDGNGKTRTLTFRLNTGDLIVAGADHALRFTETPYVHVRGGMEAKVARPVYYELANLALDEGNDPNGLWSDGVFFPMATA
jgi:uncharacterized protein